MNVTVYVQLLSISRTNSCLRSLLSEATKIPIELRGSREFLVTFGSCMFMQDAISIGYFKSLFKSCIESDDRRSRIFNIREAFRFNTFYVEICFFK